MAFTIVSAKLACGETALCGVALEPYVVLKKNDGVQITADEGYEEGTSDGNFQLRSRWYRSTINRGANYCSVHHECMICLRGKCPVHLSYHCSPECLKASWHLHKDYHRQAHANGKRLGSCRMCEQQG
jgi:CCR4-NOT transcription complex subunit 6